MSGKSCWCPRTNDFIRTIILAGFKFAARTLLELGKELISSDEVALYELIKNGIDAGSPHIEIEAEIVLTHTAYVTAIDALDEGIPPASSSPRSPHSWPLEQSRSRGPNSSSRCASP